MSREKPAKKYLEFFGIFSVLKKGDSSTPPFGVAQDKLQCAATPDKGIRGQARVITLLKKVFRFLGGFAGFFSVVLLLSGIL